MEVVRMDDRSITSLPRVFLMQNMNLKPGVLTFIMDGGTRHVITFNGDEGELTIKGNIKDTKVLLKASSMPKRERKL